jgi:hypothetical protein
MQVMHKFVLVKLGRPGHFMRSRVVWIFPQCGFFS